MAFKNDKRSDKDPIGEHPVGTGVGAVGGGAAGAVVGSAAGPVGTVVGAVAGAVAGGLGGKAITDAVDPKEHDAYWQQNFKSRPYYQQGKDYSHYAPAYRYGWESYGKHSGRSFDEVETDLRSDWERTHGQTVGTWDTHRLAVRDAYDRVGTSLREGGKVAIPVTEERLAVGKQEVEKGGVRVSTHVQERPVEAQVNLREEHVSVERRPVDRPASEADFNRAAANLEVTERAERAVVSKEARVVEEVEIGKQATERTETVRDTVRKTDVDVERIDADKTNVDRAADLRRGDASRSKETNR